MRRKQSDETDPADWFYLAEDRLRAADVLWSAMSGDEIRKVTERPMESATG